MEPVQISIVGGTGNGGDLSNTPPKMLAETAPGQPDFVVNVIRPSLAILVRFVHLFLTSFVGAIGAGEVSGALGANIFNVPVVESAFWIAAGAATAGFVKDLITVFARLEGKYPLMTGSI